MPVRKYTAVHEHGKYVRDSHTRSSKELKRDGELTMAALVALLCMKAWRIKNSCVTADVKQRIGLRFMFNIADTDQLKNALIGPDTKSLRWDRDIPNRKC